MDPALIATIEEMDDTEKKPEPEITSISKPAMADDNYRYGFERGLEAEKILGRYCYFPSLKLH